MSVNSVNSGSSYAPQIQAQPGMHSEGVAEKENDNDSDDVVAATAVNAATKPTVNTSGQTIGSIINVQA